MGQAGGSPVGGKRDLSCVFPRATKTWVSRVGSGGGLRVLRQLRAALPEGLSTIPESSLVLQVEEAVFSKRSRVTENNVMRL